MVLPKKYHKRVYEELHEKKNFFPKAILFITPNTFTAYSAKITLTFTLAMYLHFLQYNTNKKLNTKLLTIQY